jgi:SAM-dependent methyltransferase
MGRLGFDALVEEALAAPVSGWRFPFLEERVERESPSWDYPGTAAALMDGVSSALDHGTGGGELLADLRPVCRLLIATESFAPNVGVAARRLRPSGASVVQVSADTHDSRGPEGTTPTRRLPFRDSWLDLFLNRNSSFSPTEAFRLLRPGGQLLHQGGLVGHARLGHRSLRDHMGSDFDPGWGPVNVLDDVLDAGFAVSDYREQLTHTRYSDIAAVVFALRMVPWSVGVFNIDDHRERLYELHLQIERDGGLQTAWTSVFLHAYKPIEEVLHFVRPPLFAVTGTLVAANSLLCARVAATVPERSHSTPTSTPRTSSAAFRHTTTTRQ